MVWRLSLAYLMLGVSGCSTGPDSSALWVRGHWTAQHHTLKELRDRNVVKQQEDYSCGAAALATLLIYYFGDETSEKEILNLLQGRLTEEQKKQKTLRGFSLLDLKQVAQEKGYQAAGYKLTMSQLAKVAAPLIVFVEPMGYKHFAVYRGFDRGRVYLADPARGNLRMGLGRFLDEWSGIVFVLGKAGEEQITDYPLGIPHPAYVQPELVRFNGLLDLGMMMRTLPQR
jgi:predicted double-glycine peptidase